MKTGLWRSLERLSTQAGLLVEWRRELGGEFELSRRFLRPTQGLVESYPCTASVPCGCRHRVIFESEEVAVGYCDCQDARCEPFNVSPVDLVVYEVDGVKLGEAIRWGLGLEGGCLGGWERLRAQQIGTVGVRRSPVFFYVPISASETVKELERVWSVTKRGFLLVTPSVLFTSGAGVRGVLSRYHCGQVELAGVLDLIDDRLELTASGRGVWEAALEDFAKGMVGAGSEVAGILKGIHGEIASVRSEFQELKQAKARLERMQAEGLFKFTQKVDAKSFKVLCAILSEGDVAKACRALEMRSSTMWDLVRGWPKRGQAYAVMADLVRWRKAVGRTEVVPLNDAILTEKAPSVDYPALIADVLDGILEMTEGNWEDKAEELAECLRAATRGS